MILPLPSEALPLRFPVGKDIRGLVDRALLALGRLDWNVAHRILAMMEEGPRQG